MKSFLFACSLLILCPCMIAAQTRPLVPAESRAVPYDGVLPACEASSVLGEIESSFKSREKSYWDSDLVILSFQNMQEIGYRPMGADLVPRRYCRASVVTSDQKIRDLSYSIGEREGLIGFTWGTEWCVAGLDRNYAFGLECRSARP